MFALFTFFFPCTLCLMWAVQFAIRPGKTASERILLALCLAAAVYFFAEANYVSTLPDYRTYVIADMLSQFARPLIPPLILMYLLSIVRGRCCNSWALGSLAFGLMLGSVSLTIYIMIGIEDAASFMDLYDDVHDMPAHIHGRVYMLYEIFCVYAYRAVIITHSIIGLGYVAWLCRRTNLRWREVRDFFLHGGDIEPQHLVALMFVLIFVSILVKFAFTRYFFLEHQTFAVCFVLVRSALIYFTGFVCLYGRWATVNLRSMLTFAMPKEMDYGERDSEDTPVIPATPVSCLSMIEDEENHADRDIISKISTAMLTDRLFLNSHLTIDDIASHIGSNRTYVSNAISQSMNTSFYDYINGFRIKYAQEYMLHHPNATQEVVAEESGFANASAFNRKFKQVTQTTPRLWLLQTHP